ncbi:hypothetical protein DIPPA_01975 [Diplonema papillatum]|nr:hypothetical protein DIPPA_01975 [Diplonema papillatum]
MSRLCGILLRPLDDYLRDEKDGAVQLVRKNIIPKVMAALLAPALYTLAITYSIGLNGYAICSIYIVSIVAFALGHVLYFRCITDFLVVFLLFACSASTLFLDYIGVTTNSYRAWPMLVLILDVSLIARVGEWVSDVCVVGCTLWLLVCMVEECTRIGFYDIGDPDYDQRRESCDCEKPPCQRAWLSGIGQLAVTSLALGLDFLCTRSFSRRMLEEQEKMKQSVRAAEQIAGHLAAFDLEKADNLLGMATAVPEDFRAVLEHLLQNLKAYEPFLPQSVLPLGDFGNDPDTSSSSATSVIDKFPATTEIRRRCSNNRQSGSHGELVSSAKGLLLKSVTLLMLNVRSSHVHLLQQANSRFEDVQLTLLHHSLASIGQTVGIVEYFHGDRIIASWNTSRRCFGHRAKAVTAACSIRTGLEQSDIFSHIAVTSSASMNGNVGCSSMIRYNIVGPIVPVCSAILRLARDWNISLLVDSVVQNDVCISHSTLLVFENIVFRSGTDDEQVILWEVKGEIVNDAEEWMYVSGANHSKQALVAEVIGLAYLKQQPIPSCLPTCVTEPQLATVVSAVGSPLPPPIVIPAATRRLLTADRTLDNSPAVQSSSGALRLSSVVDVAL